MEPRRECLAGGQVSRMKVDWVELRAVRIPLRTPFETSFARETHKECLLVCCRADGLEGWGEVVATAEPLYNEETLETAWHIVRDFLLPLTFQGDWKDPDQWAQKVSHIRRNYMAKAGVEGALWDLYSQMQGKPLREIWGGVRDSVPVGISLGIESSYSRLEEQIEEALEAGYRRIKLKIKPGWDVEVVGRVRTRWPDMVLQVDANSAYGLEHVDIFQQLDGMDLLLIEQPLACDDIVDHAQLQRQIKTPLCLDESIDSPEQCRRALQLGSCRIINVKPGRMGGFWSSRQTHDLCRQQGIPVWCGGMLETGIGRLQNLALASLPGFSLPGDLSASDRYFTRDLIDPPVTLESDGSVRVPKEVGLGSRLDRAAVELFTFRKEKYSAKDALKSSV